MTSKQLDVFRFMRRYFERNDQLPSCQAIADNFGWKSVNAANQVQGSLEAQKVIERNECGKYRFATGERVAA